MDAVAAAGPAANEPIVGIQQDMDLSAIVDNVEMDAGTTPVPLAAPSDAADENNETFNITHRPALDGSLINPTNTPPTAAAIAGFSPMQPAMNGANATPPPPWYPRSTQTNNATAGVLAAMPRDEDVLMSLQLLAYVSKYCNLRNYFQKSHLVPKLKIGSDLQLLDGVVPVPKTEEEEEEDDAVEEEETEALEEEEEEDEDEFDDEEDEFDDDDEEEDEDEEEEDELDEEEDEDYDEDDDEEDFKEE